EHVTSERGAEAPGQRTARRPLLTRVGQPPVGSFAAATKAATGRENDIAAGVAGTCSPAGWFRLPRTVRPIAVRFRFTIAAVTDQDEFVAARRVKDWRAIPIAKQQICRTRRSAHLLDRGPQRVRVRFVSFEIVINKCGISLHVCAIADLSRSPYGRPREYE